MSGFTYLAMLVALFLITVILFDVGSDDREDLNFDKYPIVSSLSVFSCIVLAICTVVGMLWFTSWVLSPSPTPNQYTTEYAVKERPKNKVEVVKVVNDAIKETNRKTDFTNRACEVFYRIFTEYLSKYEIASDDEKTIECACLDRLGIAKQQYHDRVEAELDEECDYDD